MAQSRCRKFTVLDAMILIAAVAVGLAWMHHLHNSEAGGESYPYWDPDAPPHRYWYACDVAAWWTWSVGHCVATVEIALLLLRLRDKPRKRPRSLTRLPGTVACGVVLLTVSVDLFNSAVDILDGVTSGDFYLSLLQFTYLLVSGDNATLGILVAWTLLALSGRWRREPGWLDDSGIALGWFWLVTTLLEQMVRIYRLIL